MLSISCRALIIAFFGVTSCFAGTCDMIKSRNLVFSTQPISDLTLYLDQASSGTISYKNKYAEIQVSCINDTISISWNSSDINGMIKGSIKNWPTPGVFSIDVTYGKMDGLPVPFISLWTKAG